MHKRPYLERLMSSVCRPINGRFVATILILLTWLPGYGQPGPALSIQAANGTAQVSWSTNASGYWLQASDILNDPLEWYNSPWPVSAGAQFSALVPMTSPDLFFRLISSPFLPPPTGLLAEAGDSLMYVTWDSVSNALTYNLYFASDPSVSPSNYGSLPNGGVLQGLTVPQAILNTLTPGVTYYFVATAVNASGESAPSNEGSDIFGPQGEVHGSFFTLIFDGTATNQVFLPGVTVTLENSNSVVVAQATTDEQGLFVASPVPGGSYEVCWSAPGFISNCNTQQVMVSNTVVTLPPQEIDPQPGAGMVFGNVTLQDGSVPVFETNLFGSALSTSVTLKTASGKYVTGTLANDWGEYVLANVPAGTNLTLSASAEAAFVSTNIDTTVVGEANLVLPDTPPVIQGVVATLNGQPVSSAPTGSTVQLTVTATSAQNRYLHYVWLGEAGAPNLVSVDSSNIWLTLPETNGLVEVWVQVNDGYGGYADTQFFMNAENQASFNGYVEDPYGNVIPNASVGVNGASTLTDTNGYFSLELPLGGSPYSMNIGAMGYAPYYASFNDSVEGETYILAPLATLCTNWTGSPMAFSDTNGTTVELQANSLESAPGVPYFGPICVSIATYDPCDDTVPYPAGNLAVDDNGNTNWITPQATAYVMITDGMDNPLLIEPAFPATLILPLGESCAPLTNAPCVVPSWVWDPTNSVWQMTGETTNMAGDCASGPFVGPMFLLGMQAAAQPAPAQVKVQIEIDKTINLPVVMRVSSQAAPMEISEDTGGRTLPPITVPANQPVTFQLLNPRQAPNVYYTDPNNANTLVADQNKTVIVQVTKTFTENASLTLGLSAQIPLLTEDRVSANTHFLTYDDPSKTVPPNLPGGPVDVYYSAIGFPMGSTFLQWLQKNGFINPPTGTFPANYVQDAAALYFNASDLGFARSMHMKTKMGIDGNMDIAYYVVNYTTMADALLNPTSDQKAVATVAMDYAAALYTNITSTVTNVMTNRITKFYVFGFLQGGFSPTMGLRRNADLDGNGAKVVPNLCVVCHGSAPLTMKNRGGRIGWTITPPNGDVKGYFIPFDLASFTYQAGQPVQTAQLRSLNSGLYQYTPLTPAMKELVAGWYGGALPNNNNFNGGFVPTGWTGNGQQQTAYSSAIAVSCRGCHTMRPNIPFNTFTSFNNNNAMAQSVVCSSLEMPNAQRTFTIFWGSKAANVIKNGVAPNQPALLQNLFNWGACPAAAPAP